MTWPQGDYQNQIDKSGVQLLSREGINDALKCLTFRLIEFSGNRNTVPDFVSAAIAAKSSVPKGGAEKASVEIGMHIEFGGNEAYAVVLGFIAITLIRGGGAAWAGERRASESLRLAGKNEALEYKSREHQGVARIRREVIYLAGDRRKSRRIFCRREGQRRGLISQNSHRRAETLCLEGGKDIVYYVGRQLHRAFGENLRPPATQKFGQTFWGGQNWDPTCQTNITGPALPGSTELYSSTGLYLEGGGGGFLPPYSSTGPYHALLRDWAFPIILRHVDQREWQSPRNYSSRYSTEL
ncbi:hypothetical protein C8R44DRAFT_740215 [Mycena epipterygia]|nr:hypothetical protein C8R44DRAFT_740215 [Mycena epipterygia]